MENRTNMEDDRVAILEAQLSQAKLIAEEADKKYEEVLIMSTYLELKVFYRNWLGKLYYYLSSSVTFILGLRNYFK